MVPQERKSGFELSGAGESVLADWVDEQKWAWAPEETIRLPSGEEGTAPLLQVHVGDWPTGWHKHSRQRKAKTKRQNPHLPPRSVKMSLETAREVDREVAPKTHWSGPEGLGSILESGRFRVSGNVYFAPLQPFQSDPKIPANREEARDQLMAFQYIGGRGEGFVYSDQAR